MYETCLLKQRQVKDLFAQCNTEELKYEKLIELGRLQNLFSPADKIPANLVNGCQSIMHLSSNFKDSLVYFSAESEALISAGLAAIMVRVYSGESPEVILKCPPTFLQDLGIGASLTPSRANGLYSIHLRMKQDALKYYMQQNKASNGQQD